MSRIAKKPIIIPKNLKIKIEKKKIFIISKKKKIKFILNKNVIINFINNKLIFFPKKETNKNWALSGTIRSLINNIIIGLTIGFTKKLKLVGIGYRVQINNNKIVLNLGFSHPIYYKIPKDIYVECNNSNELILKCIDKQKLGQVSAYIRSYRPPEIYKGKGIRYSEEVIKIKERKKK